MAERLTTDAPEGMLFSILNMFRVKDHEVWLEGYGENGEPITLHDFARKMIREWNLNLYSYDMDIDEGLDQAMSDNLADGIDTMEGVLALLYNAGWAFAELRERLKEYEDREEDGGCAYWIDESPHWTVEDGWPKQIPQKKRCSHCGETNKNYSSPYCPHCGYRMNGGTEDD